MGFSLECLHGHRGVYFLGPVATIKISEKLWIEVPAYTCEDIGVYKAAAVVCKTPISDSGVVW